MDNKSPKDRNLFHKNMYDVIRYRTLFDNKTPDDKQAERVERRLAIMQAEEDRAEYEKKQAELIEDDDDESDDDWDDDDDYDFDDDDDELYEITCPTCGDTILLDEGMIEEGSMNCPNCNELLEFDYDDLTIEDFEDKDEAPEKK